MTALLRTFDGMLPMQLGAARECRLFGLACLAGAVLGLLYQVIRAVRVVIPHFKAVVFIEDMLFGLMFGLALVLLCTGEQTRMRGFVLFGEGFAALLVHIAVGRPLIRGFSAIYSLIRRKLIQPVIDIIAKNAKRASRKIVQKYKNLKFFKKVEKSA